MFIAIVIATVSALAIVGTIRELPRGGSRRIPTDWSRLP